jgi:hypothetical protein
MQSKLRLPPHQSRSAYKALAWPFHRRRSRSAGIRRPTSQWRRSVYVVHITTKRGRVAAAPVVHSIPIRNETMLPQDDKSSKQLGFKEYIQDRKVTNNPAGDFIYDVQRDPHFPENIETLEQVEAYLWTRCASDEAIAAAKRVWRQYSRHQRRQAGAGRE